MAENVEVIDRDYVDNFSIKDLAINNIMPKYFPEEVSNLTVGLTGMVTEYISVITEDTFNMASTMVLETFPTRAKMSSSIYSNAAIFQLSNIFVNAATCQFMILLDAKDIEKILKDQRRSDTTVSSDYQAFYIDKDTIFYIEDIPFTLDYDIEIRARKRNGKMIYSAQYVTDEISDLEGRYGMINSLSNVNDPYIKTVTSKHGYISLVLNLRQYTRNVIEENIIDNASLNYTSITIPYNNKLAGFDVFYRKAGEDEWIHLDKKVIYSLPSKDPFCYYKRKSENSVEISFTTKDAYWQPSFNSEIKVVTYSSIGEDGNFDKYEGENISIIKNNEKYDYPSSWVITAAPMTESYGGSDALDDEALQALTVEGFSTANALTTEYDLYTYFNNYKYRYGNEILFIKKRDDAVERLFSSFLFIKDNGYYYPTNTLSMDTNLRDFDVLDEDGVQGGLYIMEPGTLLSYKKTFDENGDFVDIGTQYDESGRIINYGTKYIDFVKNEEFYTTGDFSYPAYLDAIETEEYRGLTYDEYVNKKHMEEIFDEPSTYTKAGHYNLFDMDVNDVIQLKNKYGFLFTSPFHMTINKNNGFISYYSLFTSQDCIMDFTKQSDLSYIHFITYTLHLTRDVEKKKRYHLMLKVLPSQENDIDDYIYMDSYLGYYINAYDNMSKSYRYTRFYYRDDGHGIFTLYCNLDESKTISNLTEKQMEKLQTFANVELENNRVVIPKNLYNTTEDIILNFTIDSDKVNEYVNGTTLLNAKINRHYTVCSTDEMSYDYRENYFMDSTLEDFKPSLSRFNKDVIRPRHISDNGIAYDSDGHMIVRGNRLRIMAKFQTSNNESGTDIGYIELIPTAVNEGNRQITFEAEFYTDDYITEGNTFRSVHHCPLCGNEIKHSNIIKDGRNQWIDPPDGYIEQGRHNYFAMKEWQKFPYYCDNHPAPGETTGGIYFDDGVINLTQNANIWIPNNGGNICIDILYFDPYVVDATNEYYDAGLDDSLHGYVLTDTYETISNPLNFITRMDMFRSAISFKDWNRPTLPPSGETVTVPLDCYIKDINLVKYSLLKYTDTGIIDLSLDPDSVDDAGKLNNFMKSFMSYYGYLHEAKYTLRNATNINVEFYNTYGKSTNFTIGDEKQEILSTNNISIAFKVWLTNGTDHMFATTELKQFIKEYIESINDDGTNSLYISNLIRSIENNFGYVHHLKFKGILDYNTDYQTITNTKIVLDNLSANERRKFVPDLLTINLNNIYIDCVDV